MKRNNFGNKYGSNMDPIFKIEKHCENMVNDVRYYSKPKIRKLMTDKILFFKRVIDLICLFHNENKYKSIIPHPHFQDKKFNQYFLFIDFIFIKFAGLLNCSLEWEKKEKLKEIYGYFIYKILNQEKEGIKQLKEDEFSSHLILYRSFGIFMNSFCFNYSFINNCSILESISFFKKIFLNRKNK